VKILIAYDGSSCADAALDDLRRAGLPHDTEALVVSISEIWVPDMPSPEEGPLFPEQPPARIRSVHARAEQGLQEAQALAEEAMKRLKESFPGWSLDVRVKADAPAWGVLGVAEEWGPDLIVVGTHGRSAIQRLVLGSVSQKVLAEALCSVRIARSHRPVDDSPVRIVLGVDGSADADAALRAVASRSWFPGSTVHLVGVLDTAPIMPVPPIGSHVPVVPGSSAIERRDHLQKVLEEGVEVVAASGLIASPILMEGSPAALLLTEAGEWGADTIFVGAHGHRFVDRLLLGSVSSELANRAHCSVEVVRPK
jgi:nucleotide-binding universal stress UspA family protein